MQIWTDMGTKINFSLTAYAFVQEYFVQKSTCLTDFKLCRQVSNYASPLMNGMFF